MRKIIASTLLAAALFAPLAQAQFKYLPGRDYQVLQETLDRGEAPKAIEFFWYGCPHCYDFEHVLEKWLQSGKAGNIQFEKVPAISPYWKVGAQLYYTAHALKIPDIDRKIFEAVHKDGRNSIISNKASAIDFLISNGANRDQVERVWDSLAVRQKMNRAEQLFEQSGLRGVPSFMVNGMYTLSTTSSHEELLERVTALARQTSNNKK